TTTAPARIYTLSLHDALPIWTRHELSSTPPRKTTAQRSSPPTNSSSRLARTAVGSPRKANPCPSLGRWDGSKKGVHGAGEPCPRSEEHTSELQSRENLVCRLL